MPAPMRTAVSVEPPWRRAQVPVLLVLQWLAMCLLAWPTGDFPINDDWAYVPAVRTLLDTGAVQMPQWAGMNFIAHLLWGAVFGLFLGVDFFTMRLAGLSAGLLGVLATYALCREFGAPRRDAGLAAAVLAANPIYFGVCLSFMTDATFMAAATASLWMYARALHADARRWEAAGTALAVVAILVRQTGLALPVAYAAALVWREGPKGSTLVRCALACGAGAGSHLGWKLWMQAHGQTPVMHGAQVEQLQATLALPFLDMGQHIGQMGAVLWFYMALSSALPIGAMAWKICRGRVTSCHGLPAMALLAGMVLGLLLHKSQLHMPFLGNQLTQDGLGPRLAGGERNAWFLWQGWSLLTMAGALACTSLLAVTAVCLIRWKRLAIERQAQLLMAAGFVITYIAPITTLHTAFDRYALIPIPATLAALAMFSTWTDSQADAQPAHQTGLGLLSVLCAASVFAGALGHDYFAVQRERWSQLRRLVQEDRISPLSINGGFEFNGLTNFSPHALKPGTKGWWVNDDLYKLSLGESKGYEVVRVQGVLTWLPFTPSRVHVLRRRDEK